MTLRTGPKSTHPLPARRLLACAGLLLLPMLWACGGGAGAIGTTAPASRPQMTPGLASSGGATPTDASGAQGSAGVIASAQADVPRTIVPTRDTWTFEDRSGVVLTTDFYRVFTTISEQAMVDRFPLFMERALDHYTSALIQLPRPTRTMEMYVLANRPQWERVTTRMMGSDASAYLRIERGGFSARGRAILWDIGPRDTLTIAAHEGWHQYTQTVFQDALPMALEEGVACYMEGFRWGSSGRGTLRFMPWANWERFGTLREAHARGRLLTIDELLRTSPQELMQRDADLALSYYAQVWALTHFLVEGDDGRWKPALLTMIDDARTGRLQTRIAGELGPRAASAHALRRRGVDVLSVYTGVPSASLEPAYRDFVSRVVRSGAGRAIAEGRSPIRDEQPAADAR